jgi:pimeloyl-ACP methyl ester carboxylesterase
MRFTILFISIVGCLICPKLAYTAELIELKVSGGISHKALLFQSDTRRAAVLAHQSGATMESWTKLAKKLADRGITCISIDSITPDDVIAAISHLTTKHYDDVILIGASIGGGAITQALAKGNWGVIKNVVLLSPSAGPAMKSSKINKLVLISRSDFWGSKSYATFKEASAPKTLKEYEGMEHGQALLSGKHAENVHSVIFKFLNLE